MNVSVAVRQLARKSLDKESKPLKRDILDCAIGRNSIGTSKEVVEFAKHYAWDDLWQLPNTSYKDLKQEICHLWSDYADLKVANIKVANDYCVVFSGFNKILIKPRVKVLGYVPQFTEYMARSQS